MHRPLVCMGLVASLPHTVFVLWYLNRREDLLFCGHDTAPCSPTSPPLVVLSTPNLSKRRGSPMSPFMAGNMCCILHVSLGATRRRPRRVRLCARSRCVVRSVPPEKPRRPRQKWSIHTREPGTTIDHPSHRPSSKHPLDTRRYTDPMVSLMDTNWVCIHHNK